MPLLYINAIFKNNNYYFLFYKLSIFYFDYTINYYFYVI